MCINADSFIYGTIVKGNCAFQMLQSEGKVILSDIQILDPYCKICWIISYVFYTYLTFPVNADYILL